MAITSKGYTGTVDYADWAELTDRLGAQYSVFDNAFNATVVSGGTRQVSIGTGIASGKGIRDNNDAAVTLAGASVASGDRYDLIALRRNWGTKVSQLVLIAGGPSRVLPARNTNPGVLDDHPLWLVRFSAGQTLPQELIDLRVWHGDGGCVAKDNLVRSFLTRIGTRIWVQGITWVYGFNAAGVATWVPDSVYVGASAPPYADNLVWVKP